MGFATILDCGLGRVSSSVAGLSHRILLAMRVFRASPAYLNTVQWTSLEHTPIVALGRRTPTARTAPAPLPACIPQGVRGRALTCTFMQVATWLLAPTGAGSRQPNPTARRRPFAASSKNRHVVQVIGSFQKVAKIPMISIIQAGALFRPALVGGRSSAQMIS